MTLSISILIALAIVTAEIIYDKWRWSQGKDDKPVSTWLRAGLIALYGIIIFIWTKDIIYASQCVAVIVSTFFLTFDFSLNVVRWKNLPKKYYAPYAHAYKRNINDGFNAIESAKYALAILTKKQKLEYKIKIFRGRLFWHGDKLTTSWYDLFFQRFCPPEGEVLLKLIGLWGGIYWYFN